MLLARGAGLIAAMATPAGIRGNEVAMRFGRGTAVVSASPLALLRPAPHLGDRRSAAYFVNPA